MKLAICLVVYVHKSDLHLINIFCVVIVVKSVLWLPQVVFSYFALHRSKMPLVLMTKVTNFAQSAVQTARWSLKHDALAFQAEFT